MSGTKSPSRHRRDGAARDGAQREVRIAAVGDLHYHGEAGSLATHFARVNDKADILALCGDLTTHGRPEQAEALVGELKGVEIPIVAVLGNHDHEGDEAEAIAGIMTDAGVTMLEGDYAVVEGIGFAGIKGFAGGFDRGALAPFGEKLIKDFVQAAIEDALRLENALRSLRTHTKVVLMHYSPIAGTLRGEPEIIYPFLGSSRLLQPVETLGADVVFHGHAHHGVPEGKTPSGVPVFNVALPLLRSLGLDFRVWTVAAPDRRAREELGAAPVEQRARREAEA